MLTNMRSRSSILRRLSRRHASSFNAALAAMDAIETSERLRVATLVGGLRSWAKERGALTALDDDELTRLARPRSLDPHRARERRGEDNLGRSPEAFVREVLRGAKVSEEDLGRVLRKGAELLRSEPIVRELNVRESLTIVGDLHGSLGDLNAVMGLHGTPTAKNRLVFNGDFVDRGPDGAEVLASVLALKLAFPRHVHINRGNHEDAALSRVYDFEAELVTKYGASTTLLDDADDAFCAMPLGCVVNHGSSRTLVLHGHLPRSLPSLEVLKRAPRVRSVVAESEEDVELVRDILWSDPWDQDDADASAGRDGTADELLVGGVTRNYKRNAGCLIPDAALGEWLLANNFARLVRSHETEATGAAVTPVPHGERWTVFSCSHYPNRQGLNKAAVLQLDRDGLVKVRRWDAGEDDRSESALAARVRGALWRHRSRLRDTLIDASSMSSVAKAISSVVGQDSKVWETHLLPCLADGSAAAADWNEIRDFLSVDVVNLHARHLPPRAATSPAAHAVFDLLDTDRDGVVRRADFYDAVEAVNAHVPPHRRIDVASVWGLLDCNGDGELERNELERGLRI